MIGQSCGTCGCGIVPEYRWRRMNAEARATAKEYGVRATGSAGTCKACHERMLRHARTTPRDYTREAAERLEDVHWMAEHGEGLTGAATRLGITSKGLERWLRRHDPDVLAQLIARDPHDHNRAADGSRVMDLAATPAYREKEARRTERARMTREEGAA